jgi:magnesium-transporting ATPase (P-type)
MKSIYAKLACVAIIYSVVCYLIFWGLCALSWRFFPEKNPDDQLMQQMHWTIHIVAEKIGGLVLMSFAAFLAARSHRPTWKIGIFTAIATAVIFQFIGITIYLLQFGMSEYQKYNDLVYTIVWAVLLGWFFGYLAVWKQHRREKNTSSNV